MAQSRAGLGLVAIAMLLLACAPAPALRDDPLVDRIFLAPNAEEIDRQALIERIAAADVVYIGETHDNLWHQSIQQQLLRQLIEAGMTPALGSEFFSREQTSTLNLHLRNAHHGSTADWREALRTALGWGSNRDDDWAHYEPLLSLAREAQLDVFGAELPQALRRRLTRLNAQDLHPVERSLLPALGADDPEYRASMYAAFTAGHCGWSNDDLLRRLYHTWRLRNAAMAEAVVAALGRDEARPVILITGAGHVQGNHGVYARVAEQLPEVRQLNLGLLQIGIKPRVLDEYLRAAPGAAPDHDVIWLTQRSSYVDPCERFRRQLAKPPAAQSQSPD